MVAVIVPVIINKFIMTVYHSLILSRFFRTQTSTSATPTLCTTRPTGSPLDTSKMA